MDTASKLVDATDIAVGHKREGGGYVTVVYDHDWRKFVACADGEKASRYRGMSETSAADALRQYIGNMRELLAEHHAAVAKVLRETSGE